MGAVQTDNHSLFSLRLEQGVGRLVLVDRRIADTFVVAEMNLALDDVPQRLDMTTGVEAFRHRRGQLEKLVLHFDDQDLSRFLSGRAADFPFENVEVRVVDGDILVLGDLIDQVNIPFLMRARLESVGLSGERSLLLSVYESRIYGPSELTAPQLVGYVLRAAGLEEWMNGPTAVLLDPIAPALAEVCAELGWKLPGRQKMKIIDVEATAGRIRLALGRDAHSKAGPRMVPSMQGSARARRFWADSEAKSLYRPTEQLIDNGQLERAIRHYSRQLEMHPEQSFLVSRLLQLQVVHRPSMPEALLLAQNRLATYPDDLDALTALAVAHWRRHDKRLAADTLDRIATILEAKGEVLEAAQVRCAIATVLADIEPADALAALNAALAMRRRLPGALKNMAELQARAGDWVAAIKTQEAILMAEENPEKRLTKLVELGLLALNEAGDLVAAERFFEQALDVRPDDIAALRGAAVTHERAGRFLAAVRTLDRAARLLQSMGDNAGAAETIVQLGDLWKKEPKEGIETATLRYRQALLLQPGHPDALHGLADTALAQGDFAGARKALEELIRAVDAGKANVQRSRVYLRLGEVFSKAGDSSRAALYFQKAMADGDERAEDALDALEQLHRADDRWDDVARILELGLHRYPESPKLEQRIVRLVDVLVEHQNAYSRAIQLLEVVTSTTAEPNLMGQLVDLYRQTDDKVKLADALLSFATLIDNPSENAVILTERADLLRVYLNDTDAAVEAFTQALSCDPENWSALSGLMDIYRERERFAELVPLLTRALSEAVGDEQVRLGLELGRIYLSLGRRVEAIETLEEVRVREHPEVDAARLLADVYVDAEQYDRASERFAEVYSAYTLEGYDEPVAPFLNHYAAVHLALRQPSAALELYERAIELDPDYLESYDNAQDLLLQQRSLGDVVDFLVSGLDQAIQPSTRGPLCRRVGRYLWRELRRPEDAQVYLDEASQLDPSDQLVRVLRLEVATALSDWPLVAKLMHEQLDDAPAEERPALLVRLAKLSLSELGRPQHGIELLQTALRLDPEHIPALSLMGDHAYTAKEWSTVAQTYQQLGRIEGVQTRPDDRYRLGQARLALGDFEAAYEQLSAIRAGGYEYDGMAAAFLRVCVETSRFNQVVAALPALEDLAPSERVPLLRSAARLLSDVAGYETDAIECWSKLLKLEPEDSEAVITRDRLTAIHSGQMTEDFAPAFAGAATLALEPSNDEDVRVDVEATALDQTGDGVEAVASSSDIPTKYDDLAAAPTLEHDPRTDHVPSGFQAVADDTSVTTNSASSAEAVDMVGPTDDSEAVHDDADPPRLTTEMIEADSSGVVTETGPLPPVETTAKQPDAVVEVAEASIRVPDITETQPLPVIRIPATEPLPTDSKDPTKITMTGMARIEIPGAAQANVIKDDQVVGDDDEGLRTDELVSVTASDVTHSADAHGDVRDGRGATDRVDVASDDELLSAFSADDDELPPMAERHLPSADEIERPDEAAKHLRARIAAAAEPSERAQLYLELAELVRDRLHDPDRAIGVFEAVLDEAEAGDEHWTEAMEALEDLRAVRSEWPELVQLYDRRIQEGIGDKSHLLLVKASVLKTMGELELALDAAEAGQDGSPRALELIVGLMEDLGLTDDAAERLLLDVAELGQTEAAHRRWRAGDLLKAQRPDAALDLLIQARDVLNDEMLIDECVRLARRVNHPPVIVEALLKQASTIDAEGALAVRHSGIVFEAAAIALDQMQDYEYGRRLLERALAVWEDNVDALGRLAEVLEALGDFQGLADVYRREISMLLPGPHRGQRGMKLIEVLLETDVAVLPDAPVVQGVLDDLIGTEFEASARALVARIERQNSAGPVPVLPAVELANQSGDVPSEPEQNSPIDAMLVRGMALMKAAGGLEEAILVFEDILGLEPDCLRAYEQLEILYRDAGMHEELCGILERHAAILGPVPQRSALLLHKARVAHQALGSTEIAADVLERILTDTAAEPDVVEHALDMLLTLRARKVDLERIRRILDERIQFASGTPAEPGLLTLRARLLSERLGRTDVGRADLEAAIKLDASHAKAQLALGLMILDLGPPHLALTHFRHILGTDPRALSTEETHRLMIGLRRALELSEREGEYDQVKAQLLNWRADIDLKHFPAFSSDKDE